MHAHEHDGYDAEPDYEESPQPDRIDWANLSPEDKQVFFSWLDEFFAVYLKRGTFTPSAPATHFAPPTAASARPSLPERNSTTEAAPGTKARFLAPAPAFKVQDRPPLVEHASAPPPLPGNRPPPLATSTKPSFSSPAYPHSGGACLAHRDFSGPDAHAAQFPRESVASISALAAQLTDPFPAAVDKARSLAIWLHHNITYDAAAFLSGNVQPSTPESTLRSGLAVCEGYAGLFADLALRAGLECVVVGGHGKGFGYAPPPPGSPFPKYSSNHAWNAIKLDDGTWKLVDTCWAGGALGPDGVFMRRFDPSHFVQSNEEFGKRHFPDPSEPWKQYVDRPISWEEYVGLDEGPRIALDFFQLGYAAQLLRPATRHIPPGKHAFYLKLKCEHVVEDEDECYVPVLISKNAQWEAMTPDKVRGGWSSDVWVEPGESVSLGVVKTMNGDDARGLGTKMYNLNAKRSARTFAGLAVWEVAKA
jgi:transglutaminase-like putative cysteine protease